jgi:surface antigen
VQTRRSSVSATLVALAVVLAGMLIGTPRADATSTLLCKGFSACTSAGYKNFGYSLHYREMWWRMFSGHNCTNYVAYRMVRNGMSSTRPWSGSGDARNWGVVFSSKTNQTPMVGSVAWWSSNHVAYVQQVVDANTIIISEDHWGGDFDWRKIVRSGGGWPTGFIHLTDEGLSARTAPAVSGTPKVDAPLTVSAGTWNLSGATFTYQWLANGVAIAGAHSPTYTPTAAQVSATLSVRVGASRSGYRSGYSTSAVTAAVAPGTMRATASPVVTGVAKVGGVLTTTGGSWTPAPSSTSVAWYADGVAIPGATQPTLTLGPAQLNHRITAVRTARRAGYTTTSSSSAPTAPVGPEKLVVSREPGLTGTPHVGRPLVVTPGVVGPAPTAHYKWFRGDSIIRGATSATYVPTVKDLGEKLSVRVTYEQAGYTPVVRLLRLDAAVRTSPAIRVRSLSHRSLTITVTADGVTHVGGTVTIVNAHGEKRTRTLEGGTTTFSPDWLRKGERTITVIYSGSRRVDAKTTIRRVSVK